MKDISLEQLLEAGCHFGHQVTRQNPKARNFIFEARDNIHIIDLTKTKEGLDAALQYIKDLASKGGTLLVVGTKRQAKPIIEEELTRLTKDAKEEDREKHENSPKLFHVTNRWVGGTLTNFPEIVKNYKKLKELGEKLQDETEKEKYTKREVGLWAKEKQKLEMFYGGVSSIGKLPDALFIVDTHNEHLAVREATRMGVPIVGIVDTNADPYLIDYPIPANDDAVGSIKLIVGAVIDAWIEGSNLAKNANSASREIHESGVTKIAKGPEEVKESKTTKSTKVVKKEPKANKAKSAKSNKQ